MGSDGLGSPSYGGGDGERRTWKSIVREWGWGATDLEVHRTGAGIGSDGLGSPSYGVRLEVGDRLGGVLGGVPTPLFDAVEDLPLLPFTATGPICDLP